MRISLRIGHMLLIGALGGCANLNSVHHQFGTPYVTGQAQGKAISVDVKQRFLEMSLDPATVKADGAPRVPSWIMCAEPSPDALASYSGSFAGNAQLQLPTESGAKDIAAAMAAAFAEQAAAFGLRTQSITLLRDSAFRLCEGFMNKSLEPRQFEILHRRLQNVMVATLAIEQITGYARPTVTTIGSSASASAAGHAQQALKDLDKAQKDQSSKEEAADSAHAATEKAKGEADKAKKNLDDAKTAATAAATQATKDAQSVVDAQTALNAIPATPPSDQRKAAESAVAKATATSTASDAAKTAADKKVTENTEAKATADATATKASNAADVADKAVADSKANTKLAEEALEAARELAANAIGTTAQFNTPSAPAPVSKEIADTVAYIVQLAVDRDYTKDTCLDYLVGHIGAFDPQVKDVCVQLMNAITEGVKNDAKARTTEAGRSAPRVRVPDRGGPAQDGGVFGPYNR